jgi:hypothetical protein
MVLKLTLVAAIAASLPAAPPPDPKRLLARDGLLDAPEQLQQASARISTVFRGERGRSAFNLHSYLAHYRGRYWAAWSSAAAREEDPDQHIVYATSADGHIWSAPATLAADPDGASGPARWIARGLYVEGGRLYALGALVESADYGARGKGVVWANLKLMRFAWTGQQWRAAGLYADDCMNNFPPLRISGRLSMPCRDRNMAVDYRTAKDPAKGWTVARISNDPPFHRMDEPTVYQTKDGAVHLIVRDGARSGRLIRIVSRDKGRTWEAPVFTNYPDATSKNFAARLSTGGYYLINNPSPTRRDPLAISFSRDGWTYDHPLALRRNAPAPRFAARPNAAGSLQYPHAIEHGGALWVIYSVNKEDIEVAEVNLRELRR